MSFQSSLHKSSSFMGNLKYLRKVIVILVPRYFGGSFTYKMCPKNFSMRPLSIKNRLNLFKIVQKWPILTFAVFVAKLRNENYSKLDKNLKNFSFYQKPPFCIVSEILIVGLKLVILYIGAPFC